MNYHELLLDYRAQNYISNVLNAGNSLLQMMLRLDKLLYSRITTFLPTEISLESAHQFEVGNKFPIAEKSEWIVTEYGTAIPKTDITFYPNTTIQRFLEVYEFNICIINNDLVQAEDIGKRPLKLRTFTFDNEVYYLVSQRDFRKLSPVQVVKNAQPVLNFVAVMTSIENYPSLTEQSIGSFSLEQLTSMARKSIGIIVSAYDNEGFLICEFNKSKST